MRDVSGYGIVHLAGLTPDDPDGDTNAQIRYGVGPNIVLAPML